MKLLIVLVAMIIAAGMNYFTKKKYDYDIRLKYVSILLTGVIVGVMVFMMDISVSSLILMATIPAFIVISFIDLKHLLIPDRLNLYLAILGLAYIGVNYQVGWILLAGGMAYFIVFFSVAVFVGNLGMGDVKMAFSIGVFLGFALLMKFLFFTLAAALLLSLLLLISKKKTVDSKIAFGPYLAIGVVVTIISII
ncbi:prepilin peptidase [Lysinibacillus sp. UGB7]|uniref:prepilin peptidase n=1 Tax=Lysinibacillus sp. UGB7 TaxID=3411039 RepID=UPI003B7F19DC